MDTLKIFISSTVEDLKPERQVIDEAIKELRFEPIRSETRPTQAASPREVVETMARECDIYIGILGARYGWIIPGEGISVTEFEFRTAREREKPILIYVKDVPEREPEQDDFVKKVEDFETGFFRRDYFSDVEQLKAWLKEDLQYLLAQVFRAANHQTYEWPEEQADIEPLVRKVNGGEEPRRVLLASLGKAPGVITGLYQALRDREQIEIDEVVTISPDNLLIRRCVNILSNEFRKLRVEYDNQTIDASDIESDFDAFDFKSRIATLMDMYHKDGYEIHLGIAGGLASMGALMSIVAQWHEASSVLYHLWVPDDIEEDGEITKFMTLSSRRKHEVLFPKEYELVKVPFVRRARESSGA